MVDMVPDESAPRFRATVEKRTRMHWPMQGEVLAADLGDAVQNRFGLPVNLLQYHVQVFARLTDEPRAAFVGIALSRAERANVRHRSAFGFSALQAPTAAALPQYAGPTPGAVVLDPMCGCGTISLEGAVQWPASWHLGGDADPQVSQYSCVYLQQISARFGFHSVGKVCSCHPLFISL